MTTSYPSMMHLNDVEIALHRSSDRAASFSDGGFKEQLRARLFSNQQIQVWSLDVFDTVLLRDNSSEITRFFEIGAAMVEELNKARSGLNFSAIDAFLARHRGTKASYRGSDALNGCVEGSLNEIHAVASRLLTGADDYAEHFVQAELAYETTRLLLNDTLMELISEFKSKGGRVILMSDMYMHAEHIKILLENAQADLSLFDTIYSSADIKFSKHSGQAYPYILRMLNAPPATVLHIGDNYHSDFANAVRHGLSALHLPIPEGDIALRRKDHLQTAETLMRDYGISTDIALPH